MPQKTFTALSAKTKTIYQGLEHRYGPRYTHVMISTAFFTFFVPVPGIALLAVALLFLPLARSAWSVSGAESAPGQAFAGMWPSAQIRNCEGTCAHSLCLADATSSSEPGSLFDPGNLVKSVYRIHVV